MEASMELMHPKCAGLDVHKKVVVACARVATAGRTEKKVERFGTTTAELLRLSEWLTGFEVTHVVMESTGVYWKPVWHVLEGEFELVLANAQHVKAVPGRKSDVNDAMWLAELLAHGLVRSSYVPPPQIREVRDLTRTRKQKSRARSQETLRVQKVLEDANVKLSSHVSDIVGRASRTMLEAIIAGESDPKKLAELRGKLKASPTELEEALQGRVTDHHRFLLRLHLDQIDAIDEAIRRIDGRLEQLLEPFREHVERLTTIPGVSTTIAHIIVGEVGLDMSRFKTTDHAVSWAGLCPKLDESAGKHRSTRLRHGDPWLKTALAQAALAAMRTKDTYLRSRFYAIKGRRGTAKAVMALAATILRSAVAVLRSATPYRELGAAHVDRVDAAKRADRLARRIQALGYSVSLRPAA
jgi:transposase